jgi:formyltetrahydrofolate-dependent phosphoribosylglycinamide formyltransferase
MSASIAVLASGSGSNLQAILDHFDALGSDAPGEVVLVASDRPDALALERARRRGIEALPLDREMRTAGLRQLLSDRQVTHVALAGYMRLVPAEAARAWAGRMLNVHPALLPAFGGKGMYGHHVHEAVVASGARVTGATVHFVDEQYDHGATIAQWPVPVFPSDTPETVAIRVLEVEHQLYPRCVAAVAAGRISLGTNRRVALPDDRIRYPHFAASDAAGAADAFDSLASLQPPASSP